MIQRDNTKRAVGSKEAHMLRGYHCDPAPLGNEVIATLKGKSWGRSNNLLCYFTAEDTGANFTVSVFKTRSGDRRYCAEDESIDFSAPGIVGFRYQLTIQRTEKYPKLVKAALV